MWSGQFCCRFCPCSCEKLENFCIFGQKKWPNGHFSKQKWPVNFAKNRQKWAKNGQKWGKNGLFWVFLTKILAKIQFVAKWPLLFHINCDKKF